MAADIETVVVGAGVVGLAIARRLALLKREVAVLERNTRPGQETSARNSEVIHAGLYYAPGSLKARLCVEGRKLLYRFATTHGVTAEPVGKLLVATDAGEAERLAGIMETARQNGVTDLVTLSGAQARALEPEVECIAACLSPSTGVVDSHAFMQALEAELADAGGDVALDTAVTELAVLPSGDFAVTARSGTIETRITARHLVIAAGHDATRLGQLLPSRAGYAVPETWLAKGHYFILQGKAPFSRLVYPVPSGGSLGIHFTRDPAGGAKFGPDISWIGRAGEMSVSYEFDDADGARRRRFEDSIRRYWPGLPSGKLQPGYTGIRPKLSPQGAPAEDFAIHGEAAHGIPRLTALYGIESPGLTASLAIAEHVAGMMAGLSRREGN